jgi:molecular chaperone GrpE
MTNSSETATPNGTATAKDPSFETAQGGAETEVAPSVEAVLKAEVASLKDRILRTMAEMENLRRRTEKEVADAKAYGVSSFARDMLVVADNLQRARASLSAETRQELGSAAKSFVEGVDLTERDFLSRLARVGIKPIDTIGQRFDPNRHEALFELPDESVPSGTVVQEVETGYAIGERVLRPAKVGVSRGGPKPEVQSD